MQIGIINARQERGRTISERDPRTTILEESGPARLIQARTEIVISPEWTKLFYDSTERLQNAVVRDDVHLICLHVHGSRRE